MEQVIQTFNRTDGEKRIAVLRLEIDYELATLHEAMVAKDINKMNNCKKNLEKFRQELVRLEV
ncbi:hypothetical protein BKP37_12445 [Anaerobacillus alkalilacustris]|uniref:Uncharacterized protein n=1 Tax=Anaerobacillus alkalilacustris TaxID=393763 RepID=A0A1S2LLC4_9BACI|nr:hypothetical protein [Anaerobacillus alkalilacustris]OIJ13302.1 hypothetical protein BKP37_12445 [Anaerobacillus alkalilacustris]